MNRKVLLIIIYLGLTLSLSAQQGQTSLIERFRQHYQTEYLHLNFLFQTVFEYQSERINDSNNGFILENMRMGISGRLDQKWCYQALVNFVQEPALLDANLSYHLTKTLKLKAGRFKAPFSKEYLTSAASIDFVNRSQIVSNLAPGRQVGFQMSGLFLHPSLSFYIGIFNGNSDELKSNDNQSFLYAGRVSFITGSTDGGDRFEMGVNVARSKDDELDMNDLFFSGIRQLVGGDIRLNVCSLLFAGEYIYADFEGKHIQGYYTTIGFSLTKKSQILLRYDSMDNETLPESTNLFILGFNLNPTDVIGLQFNYIFNEDFLRFKYNQVLINLQMSI